MTRFYAFFLLLFLCGSSFAQQGANLEFCGSLQGRSKWLREYQQQPDQFQRGGGMIYVNMAIHIVGTDQGAGYYNEANLLEAFCLLNENFAPVGIQFVMAGEILYHNNSAYYQHESVLDGAQMMAEYNVENALNTYFVSDPAGNCGYNLPYAGIANANGCSSPTDITWSHEVGHALSLPHPFLGWEGGVSWDGSVDHNFSDPAPERVTYDYTYFQDTLILDTLIIDTTFVELVDGSNCTIAADGFCDTPPDYLASRWTCNGNGVSPAVQHDPQDVAFQSDGSLIMNYANDACQNRFTPEQQDAMRAFLYDQRADWLITPLPGAFEPITEQVSLISPEDGEVQSGFTADLSWTAVESATNYLVQVSRLSSFPTALTTTYITNTPILVTEDLEENRTYYWRVKPYNEGFFCTDFSENQSFQLEYPTSVQTIASVSEWTLLPQPLSNGNALSLALNNSAAWSGQMSILNPMGQTLWQEQVSFPVGQSQTSITATATLPAGVYIFKMSNGKEIMSRKFVVQ